MDLAVKRLPKTSLRRSTDLNRRRGGRARSDGLGKVRDDLSQESILHSVHSMCIVHTLYSYSVAPQEFLRGAKSSRERGMEI